MREYKTKVIYEKNNDIYHPMIRFVAIQTLTKPPYVWEVYVAESKESLPKLNPDMLLLPIDQAKRLFNFKKGNIEDCVG